MVFLAILSEFGHDRRPRDAATRLLPEEALPRREVRACVDATRLHETRSPVEIRADSDAASRTLEQRVLEDALDAAEGLDHVRAVVV